MPGWWTVKLGRAVVTLVALGLLAGCHGTSTGGSSGTGDTGTSNSSGNGYGGNGGNANGGSGSGGNGGTGGNGGNGYGGWGANGYGGNGADGHDGADGMGGAVAGSGHPTTRTIDLSGVTSVLAGANFVVHLRMGHPAQATVTMDDNVTDRVEAIVAGTQLRLGIKPGMSVRNVTLSADVTVGQLDQLATAGASRVMLDPVLTGDALTLDIAGGSAVTGPVAVERVQASVSGAGTLALSGNVQELRFSAAGASQLPLADLTVRNLDATLSGASRATVTVTDTLAAQADGASALRYRGNPNVTRAQTSGTSAIVRD